MVVDNGGDSVRDYRASFLCCCSGSPCRSGRPGRPGVLVMLPVGPAVPQSVLR